MGSTRCCVFGLKISGVCSASRGANCHVVPCEHSDVGRFSPPGFTGAALRTPPGTHQQPQVSPFGGGARGLLQLTRSAAEANQQHPLARCCEHAAWHSASTTLSSWLLKFCRMVTECAGRASPTQLSPPGFQASQDVVFGGGHSGVLEGRGEPSEPLSATMSVSIAASRFRVRTSDVVVPFPPVKSARA